MNKKNEGTAHLFLISKIGLFVIFSILIFFGAGLWLEQRYPTGGMWILFGVCLGVALGFFRTYKEIMNMQDRDFNDT